MDFTKQSWCFNGLVLYIIPATLSFWDNFGTIFLGLRNMKDHRKPSPKMTERSWRLGAWELSMLIIMLRYFGELGWLRRGIIVKCQLPRTPKHVDGLDLLVSSHPSPHHAPSATMGPYYFGWWLSWQSWSLPWWSAPTFVRPTPKTRRRTPGKCWLWKFVAGVNWNVTPWAFAPCWTTKSSQYPPLRAGRSLATDPLKKKTPTNIERWIDESNGLGPWLWRLSKFGDERETFTCPSIN